MERYDFKSEAEALAYNKNPIDELAPLAAAKIPLLNVYGDADKTVPWDENTKILAERYRQLGGNITLICKPGADHHPHGLPDPTPMVEFIFTNTVPPLAAK
jgi:alpha-beta hydrolase superfamily lysophospholipase